MFRFKDDCGTFVKVVPEKGESDLVVIGVFQDVFVVGKGCSLTLKTLFCPKMLGPPGPPLLRPNIV